LRGCWRLADLPAPMDASLGHVPTMARQLATAAVLKLIRLA